MLSALAPDEDRKVAAHLQQCLECSAEYLDLSETASLLFLVTEDDITNGVAEREEGL